MTSIAPFARSSSAGGKATAATADDTNLIDHHPRPVDVGGPPALLRTCSEHQGRAAWSRKGVLRQRQRAASALDNQGIGFAPRNGGVPGVASSVLTPSARPAPACQDVGRAASSAARVRHRPVTSRPSLPSPGTSARASRRWLAPAQRSRAAASGSQNTAIRREARAGRAAGFWPAGPANRQTPRRDRESWRRATGTVTLQAAQAAGTVATADVDLTNHALTDKGRGHPRGRCPRTRALGCRRSPRSLA